MLGGELAGAGEIKEKRVVVADEAVKIISPVMPLLCGETTNAVSILNLEECYCPVLIVSSLMKVLVAPSMFRPSIFENSFINFLVFHVYEQLFNLRVTDTH